MNVSTTDSDWLLLLYLLPAPHAPARVQAWRRLQRLGAVALKNSAYVLPYSAEAREDFEWIKNEIVAIGGQALVLTARAPDAATRDEIVATFRAARAGDFETLAAEAATLLERSSRSSSSRRELTQAHRRLRERFEEAVRVDFFATPGRDRVAELLARIDQHTRKGAIMRTSTQTTAFNRADYQGKTWLTRPRPGVDRMSSAWLIRRFIDPAATFVFGDPAAGTTSRDAIPFDTFEAEFGHHASHCTFETLCDRFGIEDEGARRIGRIVHDLDLKEETFREAEALTVGRMVEGLRRMYHDDQTLLSQGVATFEALYQSFASDARASSSVGPQRKPEPSRGKRRQTRRRQKPIRR
jgi:hypothetical protein